MTSLTSIARKLGFQEKFELEKTPAYQQYYRKNEWFDFFKFITGSLAIFSSLVLFPMLVHKFGDTMLVLFLASIPMMLSIPIALLPYSLFFKSKEKVLFQALDQQFKQKLTEYLSIPSQRAEFFQALEAESVVKEQFDFIPFFVKIKNIFQTHETKKNKNLGQSLAYVVEPLLRYFLNYEDHKNIENSTFFKHKQNREHYYAMLSQKDESELMFATQAPLKAKAVARSL